MSSLQYHALWLALVLVLTAALSAFLTRHAARRELRRSCAQAALEALARYSEWMAAQRRTPGFDGERLQDGSPWQELLRVEATGVPELAPATLGLLRVHVRMLDFLWRQQLLRTRDPEAWLDSDHDSRFMALWAEHQDAVHALAQRLRSLAGALREDPAPEFVFPA